MGDFRSHYLRVGELAYSSQDKQQRYGRIMRVVLNGEGRNGRMFRYKTALNSNYS